MLAPQPTTTYRFGPFEADLRTGELRKHGVRLKLQELPFRLLVSLLERAGDVVTREELQAKLWPEGTFVDFERGLGTALNKVREALCDSAAGPRFIETLPRRGYRFIAAVQREEVQREVAPKSEAPEPEASEPKVLEPEAQEPEGEDAGPRPHALPPPMRPAQKYRMAAIVAALVVAVLAGGAAYSRLHTVPLTDQDVLVLADFTNITGDAAFDGALRQALAFELEQSPFLKVMDDGEVNQTLQLMGRPPGQAITNDIAHEVCVREGEKATIGGSIASLGKTYQVALQAINCQTGATLAREQAEAEDKEHVLKAVAKTAAGIRAKLGESLSSIQKPNYHSAFEVTTNSLEALKAYQLGWDLIARNAPREAILQFQRAIQMDPNFAQAYDMLGIAYGNSRQPARQRESLAKAFALIDRVSERERLYITGHYYQYVTRELNKAIDAYQVATRTYPRFAPPHNGLYMVHRSRGEYQEALEAEQEALLLEPRNVVLIGNLMGAYINLDRFDDAKAVAERVFAQKLDESLARLFLLAIAYIQDDRAAQEKEIPWFAGRPDEPRSLGVQADNALLRGQRRKAKQLYQQATEMAQRQGLTEAQFGPPTAAIDALVGDCAAARREQLKSALEYCGDPPALRLAAEQAAKNPAPNPDALEPAYRRGLAWLRDGKGAEAAAVFQKILDHPGRNWQPQYTLSYLGLARASVLTGDTAKARKSYQDFLAIWKDADPDVPMLTQARREYAALPARQSDHVRFLKEAAGPAKLASPKTP